MFTCYVMFVHKICNKFENRSQPRCNQDLPVGAGHARGQPLLSNTCSRGGEKASHLYIMSYSIGVSNSRAAFSRSSVWPSAHISLTATASGVMSRASRTPGSSPTARPTS